jgi:hypothetical protein
VIGFGNAVADKLAREGTVHQFVGPEPTMGISRQNIRWATSIWEGGGVLSVEAGKMIAGHSPTANTGLLSLKSTQFGVVTGPLTGTNTLRRSLQLMGLTNIPL